MQAAMAMCQVRGAAKMLSAAALLALRMVQWGLPEYRILAVVVRVAI
jgi:hypothetical protein